MKKIIVGLFFIFQFISGYSQKELFESNNFFQGENSLPYRILFPENFDTALNYPVLFFLHGSGERGNDNELQLVHGKSFFSSDEVRKDFPAVIIFPQCPKEDYWAKVEFSYDAEGKRIFGFRPKLEPTQSMQLFMSLVDSILTVDWADTTRFYIGGLSMGGMGTFEILHRMPDVFAAAFPICGGGDPITAISYANKVNLWIFHGEKDDVVPVKHSYDMFDAVKKAGGNPRLTIYPEVNHNAWDYVFLEKELMPWLFSNKK
jgi:predicted peptidase